MLTDREIVNLVCCHFCNAGISSPCKDTRTGKLTRHPHPSRREDAGWVYIGERPGPWDEDECPIYDDC